MCHCENVTDILATFKYRALGIDGYVTMDVSLAVVTGGQVGVDGDGLWIGWGWWFVDRSSSST